MLSPHRYSRRDALRLGAGAWAAASAGRMARGAGSAVPSRPNIVLLVADDHRHSALGCRGEPVQTPTLDQLAAEGACFTQAHHMGGNFPAVCVPTRGSLMTGCTVFRALADQSGGVIAPGRVTLGQHFRAAGYRTHLVGKWHNDPASLTRSFDGGEAIFLRGLTTDQYRMRLHHFDPTGRYQRNSVYHPYGFSSDLFADRAIDFLRGHRGGQPFFLTAAFTAPHDPRTPPKAFARMYRPDAMPLPPNFAADHPFDNGELHVRDEELIPHPRTPHRVQRELAEYYGMVSSLDAAIGRILAALAATGRDRDTIVVYTGDHGLALGQHGLLGKQNLYDHSLRVPLLMRGPGIRAGQGCDALLYSWDLFPTLCDLTGVPAPADLDARSLVPLLQGETAEHRRSLHAHYRGFQRMAKNDRYKLIQYAVGQQRHTQLFDLRNDPWEMRNLAGAAGAAPALAALQASMVQWDREVRPA